MFGNVWEKLKGGASAMTTPLMNAWDKASAPGDDELGMLADIEEERFQKGITESTPEWEEAWNNVKNAPNAAEKIGKAMGAMAGATGQPEQTQMSGGGGVRTGGGTNIQTEDQYAQAMKMLVEKYGHIMFNKDF